MFAKIKSIVELTEQYARGTVELAELKIIRAVIMLAVSLVLVVLFGGLLIIISFIFLMGVSIAIGRYLGNIEYGFFVTGTAMLLLFFLLYVMRKSIFIDPLRNFLLKKFD